MRVEDADGATAVVFREVFVNLDYFSRDPSALLSRRDALLRALAECME